jgi:hypothetical protein
VLVTAPLTESAVSLTDSPVPFRDAWLRGFGFDRLLVLDDRLVRPLLPPELVVRDRFDEPDFPAVLVFAWAMMTLLRVDDSFRRTEYPAT